MPYPPQSTHARRALLGAALACALAGAALAGPGERAAARGEVPPQPNIVLIMTDDQPLSTVTRPVMRKLFRLMVDRGTTFSDFIVTTPLCCPSRATAITGQYGHNNNVLFNDYDLLRGKRNTLPVWLRKAGYRTAHLGKYMNRYEASAKKPQTVAPGWDKWFTQLAKRRYYNWTVSKNGTRKFFGEADRDHLTEVINKRAGRWAAKLARKDDPFYMQVDYYAPHGAPGRDSRCRLGPVPAPRDEGVFDGVDPPEPPSFNEADVSDKPAFIRELPLLDEAALEKIERRWRCMAEALRSVDRGIARLHRKLERAGELDNTVFIFSSDNGYYLGEHRIPRSKRQPYEENLRMPLTIVVPPAYRAGAPVVPDLDAPVANVDLAPTILDLAGAEPCRRPGRCRTLDGRSLLPLLDGSGGFPASRAFVIERSDCVFRGVRVDRQIYLEHGEGPIPANGNCRPTDIEHYDLAEDPFQLENLYPASRRSEDGRLQLELADRMRTLAECAGIAGRDPLPDSGVHCE